jgi:hypothetical protein
MRRLLPALCLCLLTPALAMAQPQLSVSPSEVPSGGAITVTVTGTPGLYWALVGSFRDNGLVYGGTALAVGTDVQILGTGFFDPSGTVNVPFVPPLANGIDEYFLQAVSSPAPNFIPLTASAGIAVRPRGLYTNTPTFPEGLSAGGARVTNVATPVAGSDAASKSYVDASAARIGPGTPQSTGVTVPLIDLLQTGGDAVTGTLPSLMRLQFGGTVNGVATPASDRLRLFADGSLVVAGVKDDLTPQPPVSGPGVRFMWAPQYPALRIGRAMGNEWDAASLDEFSVAIGNLVTATGYGAFAGGDQVSTGGTVGFGYGSGITVSGTAGVSFGAANLVSGFAGVGLGYTVSARGQGAVALGYRVHACGDFSVALGYRASTSSAPTGLDPCAGTIRTGTFVFGDESTTAQMPATGDNQFLVRAAGGTRFYTNAGLTTGVSLNAGGSSWNVISDRRAKFDIRPLDEQDVLRRLMTLPLSSYLYKDGDGQRYIGPMAQDFKATFALGDDDTRIRMNDLDGVALASIKALGTQVQDLRDANARLADENAALKATLEALAGRLAALEQRGRQ